MVTYKLFRIREGRLFPLYVEHTREMETGVWLEARIGELADEYQIGDKIDVAGNLEINEYNGKKNIQIVLKDLRKSIK